MGIPGWTPPVLLSLGTQAVSGRVSAVVINVPGPQRPLHLLGARLLEMVPVPPLLPGVGLAIALFSYDGTLSCGLLADYDLMPDLGRFPGILRRAFVELAAALGVEVEATGPVSR
jgi:diacylglycerol O-acyltransferase